MIPVIVGLIAPWAVGAEPADSINLGLGGLNPMPHCNATVYVAEYEHSLTPTMAILGRGSGVEYKFNNGSYLEDGRLRGVDIGARYYPAGGSQGLFMGASVGRWKGDWTFTQYQHTPIQWQGTARSNSVRLNFEFGDRIPINGTNISIMPEVDIGKFFATRSCLQPIFHIDNVIGAIQMKGDQLILPVIPHHSLQFCRTIFIRYHLTKGRSNYVGGPVQEFGLGDAGHPNHRSLWTTNPEDVFGRTENIYRVRDLHEHSRSAFRDGTSFIQ